MTMSDLFWPTDAPMERLKTVLPKSHGRPPVDDRRVPSGMIVINRNGSRWCDAPREHGPPKTLCDRWKRWGDTGGLARMMAGPAPEGGNEKGVMIDATHLKVHRPASRLRATRGADDRRGRLIGRTTGGFKTGRHAVNDAKGRPRPFFMTAGRVSDPGGAAALPGRLPAAEGRIGTRGLWCSNPVRDSSRESSVEAGAHEQTRTARLRDRELARL